MVRKSVPVKFLNVSVFLAMSLSSSSMTTNSSPLPFEKVRVTPENRMLIAERVMCAMHIAAAAAAREKFKFGREWRRYAYFRSALFVTTKKTGHRIYRYLKNGHRPRVQ